MGSIYERGYVELNPDLNDLYDMEHNEGIYVPSDYPFSIPKVYLEGACDTYFPQIVFDWSDDTVIVVRGKILTKYTKHCYTELLAEDETGHIVWIDGRTAPFEECWKGKYLEEVRGALEYDVEEFNLDVFEKKTYKVTLESTSSMSMSDLTGLVDYIDPNIIKKFRTNDDTI